MFSGPAILCSLVQQVSHPPFKNHSFCLADNGKNPYILYHKLWEAYPPHFSDPFSVSCFVVNINTLSFILNTSGSNMECSTKTSHALPFVYVFSSTLPCSIQLITSLLTLSLVCSFNQAALYKLNFIYSPFKLNHRFLYLVEFNILFLL